MNIYKISQTVNIDYNTYDSAIVYARSEEDARYICPDNYYISGWWEDEINYSHSWCHPDFVTVDLLGEATDWITVTEAGVILASFNAG